MLYVSEVVILEKLRVVVITQDDLYAIPRNVRLLCDSDAIAISEVIIVDSANSLVNKKWLFVKGFGLEQTFKMSIKTVLLKAKAVVAHAIGPFGKMEWLNLKGLCFNRNIPLYSEADINCPTVLQRLRKKNIDVIVSYSAPTVFKQELLDAPKFGCINLHCSALPSYAGVMPSFWMLLNSERQAGVSVHLMDCKIDNGDVLAQENIDISDIDNMFQLILATKLRGGQLMLDVLHNIYKNRILPVPLDTSHNIHSYFTWPTAQDFKRLVAKGKKLI